jgi:hypothetical protein
MHIENVLYSKQFEKNSNKENYVWGIRGMYDMKRFFNVQSDRDGKFKKDGQYIFNKER